MVIATETWRRFTDHWGALGIAGLYAAVIGLAAGLVFWVITLPVVLSTGVGVNWAMRAGVDGLLEAAMALVLTAFVVASVLMVAVAPLITGGLVHAVVQVQAGQPAKFGDLWQAGLRHWGRLFRLHLLMLAVWVGLIIAYLILHLVPVLGTAVWALGAGMIMIVLGGYGPYMAVTEGLGARQTVAKAYRILSDKFTDVLLTLLVLLAAGVALGLVGFILNHVPLLGGLAMLIVDLFVGPLCLLYLATRYRTNIAPHFGPPGGTGTWDLGPPPGP